MRLNLRSEVESSLTRVNGLPIAKLRKVEFVSLYCICICVLYLCNCKHLYLCLCHCIWKLLICIKNLCLCTWVFDGLPVAKLRKAEIVGEAHNPTTKCIPSQPEAWVLCESRSQIIWSWKRQKFQLAGEYHSIQIMPQLPFCARNRDNQENKSGSLQVFVKMDPNLKMPTIAIRRPARYLALSKERLLFICWSVFCGQSLAVFKWADRWMAK